MTTSLRSEDPTPSTRSHTGPVVAVLLAVALAAVAYLYYRAEQRAAALERQLAEVTARMDEAVTLSRQALEQATSAHAAARLSAESRLVAETETALAREQSEASRSETEAARGESEAARQEAAAAREKAAQAQAEAERVKRRAEAELNRLQDALGQIAETRRTALGLVMNLGGDHLKFAFDKAELRAEDRELLSRVAGILISATDYTISVNGHTDDVGTAEYNQKLSERRAQAVYDYLAQAGLSKDILSVQGHGKSRPLVPATSDAARAKNRRVELGIVNMRILTGREAEAASPKARP
jgi:outer membrane protein OmpA-like peptidoglycan-associated protein